MFFCAQRTTRLFRRALALFAPIALLLAIVVTSAAQLHAEESVKFGPEDAEKELKQMLMQIIEQGEEAAKHESPEVQEAFKNLKEQALAGNKPSAKSSDEQKKLSNNSNSPFDDPSKNPFDEANATIGNFMHGLSGMGNAYLGVLSAKAKSERARLAPASGTDPRIGKASLLAVSGKSAEAIALYEKIIQDDPESGKALFGYATLLAKAERNDEALSALERATVFEPRYKEVAKRDLSFTKLLQNEQFLKITAP
jgi:tetratricopeptide (TPR) repeat protein